jgi:hypothetical protein
VDDDARRYAIQQAKSIDEDARKRIKGAEAHE